MSQFLYAPTNLRTGWQQYRSAHDAALNRKLGQENKLASTYGSRAQELGARADNTRRETYSRQQAALDRIGNSIRGLSGQLTQKKSAQDAKAAANKGSKGFLGLGGAAAGAGLGLALAAPTGGMSIGMGALLGGAVGGNVGNAADAAFSGGNPSPYITNALSTYAAYESNAAQYPTAGELRAGGGGGYPAIDIDAPMGGDWSMVDPYSRNF